MFVNIHSHSALPADCVGILNHRYSGCFEPADGSFYSIGIHPYDVEYAGLWLNSLENYLTHIQVKAVGECGLDRFTNVSFELQQQVFEYQIDLAEKFRKPLILHAVRTYSDMLGIKKKQKSTVPWILHGYQGTPETTIQLIKAGFYFSFGPTLLKTDRLDESLKRVSPERLFFETDECGIHVSQVYSYVASCHGIDTTELQSIVYNNFTDLFEI